MMALNKNNTSDTVLKEPVAHSNNTSKEDQYYKIMAGLAVVIFIGLLFLAFVG